LVKVVEGLLAQNAPSVKFSAFQAFDSNHLAAHANALSQSEIATGLLPASSQIVIEVLTNIQIKAYLNDVQFLPVGCTSMEDCNSANFLVGLKQRSEVDAKTTCKENATLIQK